MRAALRRGGATMIDRSGGRGRRLEMELGGLLSLGRGRLRLGRFMRDHEGVCESLLRGLLRGLPRLTEQVLSACGCTPALGKGWRVYAALMAVEPGAEAQGVHMDAGSRTRRTYVTAVVPLTGQRGQGTTEFVQGDGFVRPPSGRAYAFDGRVAHRGGANLSRGWRCALCVVVCKGDDPNRLAGSCMSWAGRE